MNPRDPSAPKKTYAQVVSSGKVKIKEMSRDIADISSLSSGDIANVLENFILQIPKYLSDGKIVELGDLGTLRISVSSEVTETEKAFSSAKIKKKDYFLCRKGP